MSNFTLAILEFTDEISVISREQKYINRFKPLLHFVLFLLEHLLPLPSLLSFHLLPPLLSWPKPTHKQG
jgi:hypothetical protein